MQLGYDSSGGFSIGSNSEGGSLSAILGNDNSGAGGTWLDVALNSSMGGNGPTTGSNSGAGGTWLDVALNSATGRSGTNVSHSNGSLGNNRVAGDSGDGGGAWYSKTYSGTTKGGPQASSKVTINIYLIVFATSVNSLLKYFHL